MALITGAGGGIGRELAVALRRDFNCHLSLCDADETRLMETDACVRFHDDKTANLVSARTTLHVLDVSDRAKVLECAEDVRLSHGHLELVFNVAGVASTFAFDDVDSQEIDRVLGINLGGVINVCKSFLPLLKKSDKACVVNVSSMEGYFAFPGNSAYVMSKFAVRGLTETLIVEGAELYPNVSFCCVHPGLVSTSIIMNSSKHILDTRVGGKHRMTAPEQVQKLITYLGSTTPKSAADQILRGVVAGETRIVIGTDAKILDYAVRLFPHFWYRPWPFKIIVGLTLLTSRFLGRRFAVFAGLLLMFYMFFKRKGLVVLGRVYSAVFLG